MNKLTKSIIYLVLTILGAIVVGYFVFVGRLI